MILSINNTFWNQPFHNYCWKIDLNFCSSCNKLTPSSNSFCFCLMGIAVFANMRKYLTLDSRTKFTGFLSEIDPDLFPIGICMFKVNNRNTRTRCEICSKLTIKTPEWRQWRRTGVFVYSEHTSHLVLVFLLLTLSK